MGMDLYDIIILDDGYRYTILRMLTSDTDGTYLLLSRLEDGTPTDFFQIVKYINENGEEYVENVSDNEAISELKETFATLLEEDM